MLSTDDQRLVARDTAIPGLAVVLDDQALAERVADLLPGRRVEACEIRYVRYKPATSCLVGFTARVDGARVVGQAKAHLPSDRDKAHKLARHARDLAGSSRGGAVATDVRTSVTIGDDLVTTTLWPMDRTLPGVARLADPRLRRRLLRHVLPDRHVASGTDVVPLSYKPDRRLVARVDGPEGPVAVLRCLDAAAYPAALAGASFAWEAPVARLLGHDVTHSVLATEWMPADRLLADAPWDDLGPWVELGAVAGLLHDSRGEGLVAWSPSRRAEQVLEAAGAIRAVLPGAGQRAERVARTVAAGIGSMPSRRAPLHGDLSPDQVLLDGGDQVVIDFDAARRGDPADDLGSVGASLVAAAVRAGRPASAVHEPLSALVAGHGRGVQERDIALWVAAGLLARATEPFRHRWRDWSMAVDAMVDAADWWSAMAASANPGPGRGWP